MKRSRKNKGMLSLFDAMLFFVIMIIASGLLLQIGMTMSESAELIREQQAAEYNDRVRLALMGSSIPYADFTEGGIVYERGNSSVQQLILENLYLIEQGVPNGNIDYAGKVQMQANLLIDPIYDWAVRAESGTASVTIFKSEIYYDLNYETFRDSLGKGEFGDEEISSYKIHASTWRTYGFVDNEEVQLSLYLW